MKLHNTKIFLLLAGLAAFSCTQKEEAEFSATSVCAVIEDEAALKSAVTDAGVFTWAAGDQISIYTTSNAFKTFTIKPEDAGKKKATFKAELSVGEQPARYAVYPAGNHKVSEGLAVNLPTTYGSTSTAYAANANAAMVAVVEAGQDLAFRHVGGVLRFSISNIPADAAKFVFKTAETITGDFAVSGMDTETPAISNTAAGGREVALLFKPGTVSGETNFYIPLPTGTYQGFTIQFQNTSGNVLFTLTSTKEQTLKRQALARVAKINLDNYQVATGEDMNKVDWKLGDDYVYDFSDGKNMTAESWNISNPVLFQDDFEQTSSTIDPYKWTYCYPGEGAWAKYMNPSPDNVYVKNGKLILKAEKVGDTYKCGGVTTQNKHYWNNCRVEVNAKMAENAQGGWQAIWMMAQAGNDVYSGWPAAGEIDIVEHLNHDTYIYNVVHTHWTDNLGHQNGEEGEKEHLSSLGVFRTYAVDITDEALIFYVDGKESFRYANKHLADEATQMQYPFASLEYFLMINFALGGEGTWPGAITDSQLPVTMEVDWVKVTSLE